MFFFFIDDDKIDNYIASAQIWDACIGIDSEVLNLIFTILSKYEKNNNIMHLEFFVLGISCFKGLHGVCIAMKSSKERFCFFSHTVDS